MKKQIVFFVVGIAVFAAGYVAQSWTLAENGCRVPSVNQVFCYKPTNETKDCSGLPGPICNTRMQYVINKFPDGTTDADTGSTTEEKVDCYQATLCRQGRENTDRCETSWVLPFETGDKTVVGKAVCPTE